MRRHQFIERILACMAERGVPEIMREGQGFCEILVEPQAAGQRAGDLAHLDGMREARAIMVALMLHENLRLVFQAAEGGGMDDAVAVALEFRARRRGSAGKSRPREARWSTAKGESGRSRVNSIVIVGPSW